MPDTVVLRVQTIGMQLIQRRLRQMARQGRNLRVPLTRAGAVVLAAVDANFEAEGRPQRWKPRAPLTMAALRSAAMVRAARTKRYANLKTFGSRVKLLQTAASKGGSTKILGGSFRQSMVMRVQSNRLIVGSAHPGARIHQLGGVIRPKAASALFIPVGDRLVKAQQVTIPARPYLVVPAEDQRKVVRVFWDWIRQGG